MSQNTSVRRDGGFEVRNTLEGAAPDLLAGDFGEQALHQIKPGRGGGRVVHLETRMLCQPCLNLLGLVGPVVVANSRAHRDAGPPLHRSF